MNSEYGNVTRLEKKLNDLTAKPAIENLLQNAMPGMTDVRMTGISDGYRLKHIYAGVLYQETIRVWLNKGQ